MESQSGRSRYWDSTNTVLSLYSYREKDSYRSRQSQLRELRAYHRHLFKDVVMRFRVRGSTHPHHDSSTNPGAPDGQYSDHVETSPSSYSTRCTPSHHAVTFPA